MFPHDDRPEDDFVGRTETIAELRRFADALEQLDDATAFEALC